MRKRVMYLSLVRTNISLPPAAVKRNRDIFITFLFAAGGMVDMLDISRPAPREMECKKFAEISVSSLDAERSIVYHDKRGFCLFWENSLHNIAVE